MQTLAEVFQGNVLATCFGAMGLACQLAWPMFRQRRSILTVQFGIGADYGAQYALLGAWSGAGVAFLGATQTVIALIAGDRPWLRKLGFGFIPAAALIGFLTWSGVASVFAIAACSLIMAGRMQRDTIRMRSLMLAAAPFGIGYDLSVGAAPALIGAIVSACLGIAALLREVRARRGTPAIPDPIRLSAAWRPAPIPKRVTL
ncbi:YgjV family protein [Ostreiculturibacter nitratireducens]|uniref:YgjV family protein n=1 Tax=Ostreiculturibacter nitratireducens TaxID=3075226 RepID=UPI0031B619B4